MIETVLMVPFIIVMIFFVYQAFITTNKVGVVQKYLKSSVVGRLMNRYEVTAEKFTGGLNGKTPTDGQYFYVYNEYDGDTVGMNAGIDKATASILLTFMTDKGDRPALEERLTNGKVSSQGMGVCIGGTTAMEDQVSPKVFQMQDGDTCAK